MALFNSMVQLCVPIEMEHVSLAGMGTPGKPQPIVQAAVGSELKPPGIVMPHTESETRKKILDKLSCRMLFQFVENRAPLTSQSVCTVTFSGSRSICTFLMGGGGVVMVMLIDFLVWWWCCRCCGEQRKQASSVNRSCILWNFGNFRPRLARLLLVWGPDGHIYKNVHMCECIIYFPRVLNITDLFGQSSSASSQLGGKCVVETQLLIDTLGYKWDTVLCPIPTAPASFVAVNNVTGHGDAGVCFNMLHSNLSASSVKGQVADRRLMAVPNQRGRSPTTTCYNRVRFKE